MPPARVSEWLRDQDGLIKWVKQYDLPKLLKQGGGFVRIPNLLPDFVADWALEALQKLPGKAWEQTGATDRDDASYADSIPHHFSLFEVEDHEALMSISRLLWFLVPHTLPNFTAARYSASDHIAPHDDLVVEQYTWTEIKHLSSLYDPSSTPDQAFGLRPWKGERSFTRELAAVYYLNRDWLPQYGGTLVDLETGQSYLPEFNTLVVFEVPRMHEVTVVEVPKHPRYSIFGWWLAPEEEDEPVGVLPSILKRPSAAPAKKQEGPSVLKRPAAAPAQKLDAQPSLKRPAAALTMKRPAAAQPAKVQK